MLRLIYLEVLKHQKSCGNIFRGFKVPRKQWLMFLEGEQHKERYDRQFYRLQNTKQSNTDVLIRCINRGKSERS